MGALGGEAEMKSRHLESISDLTADHEQHGGRALPMACSSTGPLFSPYNPLSIQHCQLLLCHCGDTALTSALCVPCGDSLTFPWGLNCHSPSQSPAQDRQPREAQVLQGTQRGSARGESLVPFASHG